ncbi:MAG TPA: metallophosphoesterase [Myxococcales bacterium]|nr:metallophosphoesterase [Myxococcales bacterium]
MRRARFYILVLGLTLLPQVVAASDLVRWLADQDQIALGLTVPGVLLALNLPMLAEILRRKKKARLPRFLAAALQTPWTMFWLGSFFYALLRAGWTVAHLGPSPMPVPVALAPFGLAAYGALFGARALRREKVTVPVAGLPEGWNGIRIVQLSDLHAGRHVTRERLRGIARRAARLKADLVVVTGDIVHNSPEFARQAAEAIASIPSRLGIFACLGNHDFWAGPDAVEEELTRAGVQVLRNRGVLLESRGEGLWLCGVDDPWGGRFDLGAALRGRPEGTATVLLSHQPNTWRRAQDLGVELQLSGHTHGGQLALLWLHRSLSLARLITPFVAGLYRAGRSYLYVNRGAGSVMPMVRIGARPEVTELTLVPADEDRPDLALAGAFSSEQL